MEAKVSDILIGYISEPEYFQWNNLYRILKDVLKLSKIKFYYFFQVKDNDTSKRHIANSNESEQNITPKFFKIIQRREFIPKLLPLLFFEINFQ